MLTLKCQQVRAMAGELLADQSGGFDKGRWPLRCPGALAPADRRWRRRSGAPAGAEADAPRRRRERPGVGRAVRRLF